MPSTGPALSLLLADDHKIVRDGLRALLVRQPGMSVIGDAADGRALVAEALRLRPDVVVTDVAMPELNGLDAVRQLRAAGFAGSIIMLSMRDERRLVAQAFNAGANGYVLKDYAFEQLLAAIAAAREGKIWLSPQLRELTHQGAVQTLTELLTVREREVLQLLAEGHATKEVAFRLNVSPKTIETHRLNLLAKLRVGGVADLVRVALKEGLVEL